MSEHTPTPLKDLALGIAMPETAPSPTPWRIAGDGYIVAECIPVRGNAMAIRADDDRHGMQAEAEANAAFIVKAVNSHDALVKALEGIAEFCSSDANTLGAIERLAHIRNTAVNVLAHVGGSGT